MKGISETLIESIKYAYKHCNTGVCDIFKSINKIEYYYHRSSTSFNFENDRLNSIDNIFITFSFGKLKANPIVLKLLIILVFQFDFCFS